MKKKFYITTAIDYLNGRPHIGHVFEKILADAIARYHRLGGDDVYFLTGSDEHGFKMQQVADQEDIAVKDLVDRNVKEFIEMKGRFNLSYDRFIRTTDIDHIEAVKRIWIRCMDRGDLYLKKYKGLYCTGCESFKKENDLIDGKCQDHDRAPDLIEEENWFFKLSNYKEKIKNIISSDELAIYPEHRKKEILNVLDELEDFSVSRPKEKLTWGIEVPGDSTQVMYVWFDALTNYVSGIGIFDDKDKFKNYWPANIHVIGKDITRFHAIYWPAMLLSADIELPKGILVHGHITSGGKKMSKTLGNTIDVDEVLGRYGVDALRYFLLREIPTMDDGDFTIEKFDDSYNADLANGIGNLFSRVISMVEKYCDSKVPEIKEDPEKHPLRMDQSIHNWKVGWSDMDEGMDNYRLDQALSSVWKFIKEADRYVSQTEPWILAKEDKKEELEWVLYGLLDGLYQIAWQIYPFMPGTAIKMATSLGISGLLVDSPDYRDSFANIKPGTILCKAEPLFPKKEKK